ncbi:uncharacterized protein LOC144431964 [Styela clava]
MEIEVDDTGWAAIHHCVAAEKELLMSIEKFVTMNPDNLEVETKDAFRRTPLLLAVHCNKKRSVEKLLDLGANIKAIDNGNRGVVETCVMNENINLLHYFIDLQDDNVDVWKLLINYLRADTDEETEKASEMLDRLTRSPHSQESENECTDPHWEQLMQVGGIPSLIATCKFASSSNLVKTNIANVLKNIVCHNTVPDAIVKAGGVEMLLDLVKNNLKTAFEPIFKCLQEIANFSSDYAAKIQMSGFLASAMKLIQSSHLPPEVITNLVLIVGHIAGISEDAQKAVGSTSMLFENLLGLFENSDYQTSVPLLTALTHTIESIVAHNEENQNTCINAGAATHLIMVSRASKYRDLQISAIKALYSLTANNRYASNNVLEEGAVMPLMQLLKKSRAVSLQEALARTLWALAGPDTGERSSMASMIGVNLLIEFLSAQGENSDNLNCIGCQGLAVLAQGALNKQADINDANGIVPLVRLLRSANPVVVISALRALRYLCLNIGYIPNYQNQTSVSQTRGLKLLVALLAHSKSEEIQVESALAIGAAVLGHSENISQLQDNPDFTYLHVIRLLYSDNEMVKLTAGTALATFAFNNVNQQQEISECGGVRWHNFAQFLQAKDSYFSLSAAFQAVVMSRIIPDEEPAMSSACGINVLVDVLEKTEIDDIKALAADCVARLAHTRAGVPSAMIAINVVQYLFKLLASTSEQVRGSAAVALGYLSFDHTAERQMLHLCREEPKLIHVLKYYTKNFKLSSAFLEGWKHCVHVACLDSSDSKEDNIVQTLTQGISQTFLKPPKELSTPLMGLTEDVGTARSHSHQQHGSRASQILAAMHGDDMSQIYGRSSRSSRITRSGLMSNIRSSHDIHENSTPSVTNNSISQASHLTSLAQD